MVEFDDWSFNNLEMVINTGVCVEELDMKLNYEQRKGNKGRDRTLRIKGTKFFYQKRRFGPTDRSILIYHLPKRRRFGLWTVTLEDKNDVASVIDRSECSGSSDQICKALLLLTRYVEAYIEEFAYKWKFQLFYWNRIN